MAAIVQTIFFRWIFLNKNVSISIKISLKFVPMGLVNNILALVQIMAWRQPADKFLSKQWSLVYWSIYASLGLYELSQIIVTKLKIECT